MHTPEEKFYTAVAVAAAVLGIIIIYFIVTMIRHQRRNVNLYKARIKAEISTLEKERKRIAGDLHDELGPLLSAVRIQINHLQQQTDEDRQILSFANKHIDDIITKAREISYNLLPNTLVRKGLIKAVEEYINKLKEVHNLDISYSADDVILDKEQEINIYRILQEIIHNTIKHAEASHLTIQFRKHGNTLLLMTADNGRGFDYDQQVVNNNGLGLINLQSRTEVLNATFNYESDPKTGTKYIFEIPINNVS